MVLFHTPPPVASRAPPDCFLTASDKMEMSDVRRLTAAAKLTFAGIESRMSMSGPVSIGEDKEEDEEGEVPLPAPEEEPPEEAAAAAAAAIAAACAAETASRAIWRARMRGRRTEEPPKPPLRSVLRNALAAAIVSASKKVAADSLPNTLAPGMLVALLVLPAPPKTVPLPPGALLPPDEDPPPAAPPV